MREPTWNPEEAATVAALEALGAADRAAAPANLEDRLLVRTQSMIAPAGSGASTRPAHRRHGRLAASLALLGSAVAASLLALRGGAAPEAASGPRADVLAASLEAELAPLLEGGDGSGDPWGDGLEDELLLLEVESALLDNDLEPDWSVYFEGAAS